MNTTGKHMLLVLVLCTILASALPSIAWANSAEPPSLVILVNNPPDDLSIVLVSNTNQPKAEARRVAWEGYFAYYSHDLQTDSSYTFRVTTGVESFECTIDAPMQHYNNVFTLDVSNRILTLGEYPFRSVLLVSIRVVLTLLLEGLIFWLFQFRQKRSWLAFIVINLMTQGALNIWLNSGGSLMPSYLIFRLILGEVFVFATEMIAFPIFIKEHKKKVILLFAFIANLVSLVAGGYLITMIPV